MKRNFKAQLKGASSKVEPHTAPLLIVHRSVTLKPAVNPVTPLLLAVGVVIEAPLAAPMIVHNPVPGAAAFPARVNDPLLH